MHYTTINGVQGQYFCCEKFRATISVDRCVCMYREAKKHRTDVTHRLRKCVGCHLGAGHAGESLNSAKTYCHGQLTCCRCHEPASRLLRGGICVSCFNREREIEKGANAKGTPPIANDVFWGECSGARGKGKTVKLHTLGLNVLSGSTVKPVVYRASNMLEASLMTFRAKPDAVIAQACSRPMLSRWVQMSLFGGC